MPRGKQSLLEKKNPPKRVGANRRKAKKRSTISEIYAEREQEWQQTRTRRPRKSVAVKRKRSGTARKQRGKRTASATPRTSRRA